MTGYRAALHCEVLKARRSRVPWLTALGFMLAPIVGAVFMLILRNPERARSLGIIGTKAQLAAATADWPSYLALLAQAAAVGGSLVFAIVAAWVFGREFSDGTVKEILATPTSRSAIVAAKLTVVAAWCIALTGVIVVTGLSLGRAIRLPAAADAGLLGAVARIAGAGALTALLTPWVAFFASASRGYLGALAFAILTVFLAQVAAAAGWGAHFPWSVPAMYSGVAGPGTAALPAASYVIIGITCVAGIAATLRWWLESDHH